MIVTYIVAAVIIATLLSLLGAHQDFKLGNFRSGVEHVIISSAGLTTAVLI